FSAARFFVPQLRGRGREAGKEVAACVRPHLGPDNLLLVFPDTYNFNSAAFFSGLAEEAPELAVVGGGASENGSVGETFQLCGDTVSNDAVCGMLLSGHMYHTTGITQSCQPISPVHTVTKAHRNLILELDGKPAFTVFAEVVPQPLRDDLRRAAAFVFVGVPADRERQHIARGEYLVRNIVGFDPGQGIVAIGDEVHPGQKLVFTLRDGDGSRDDLQRTLEAQVHAWEGRTPGFGLYFNCVGRGSGLYGFADLDTSYIKQSLGEVPVIGFFSGCEIAPIHQQSCLHQDSGVLTLVGEKLVH
ncbi:MAG: FIST N-terminal domain-containing protein, partial [Candidatus Binatia bacterium]